MSGLLFELKQHSMFSPSLTCETIRGMALAFPAHYCQLLWPLLTSWLIETESIPRSPQVRHLSFSLFLLHLPKTTNSTAFAMMCLLDHGSWASVCSFCSSEQGFAVWLPSVNESLHPTLPLASMLRCSHTRDLHPLDNLSIFQLVPCWAHTHNIKQLGFSGLRGFGSRSNILVGGQGGSPKTQPFHIVNRWQQASERLKYKLL